MTQQQFQSTVVDEEQWQWEQMQNIHQDADDKKYAAWCLEVNAKINQLKEKDDATNK